MIHTPHQFAAALREALERADPSAKVAIAAHGGAGARVVVGRADSDGVVLRAVPGLRGFGTMRVWRRVGGREEDGGFGGTPAAVARHLLDGYADLCHPRPVRRDLVDTALRAIRHEHLRLAGMSAVSGGIAGSTPELVALCGDGHEHLALGDFAPPADPWLVWHADPDGTGPTRVEGPVRDALARRAARGDDDAARLLVAIEDCPEVPVDATLARVPCGDGLPAYVPPGTYDPDDVPRGAEPLDAPALAARADALVRAGRPGSALVTLRSPRFLDDDGAASLGAFGRALGALGRRIRS